MEKASSEQDEESAWLMETSSSDGLKKLSEQPGDATSAQIQRMIRKQKCLMMANISLLALSILVLTRVFTFGARDRHTQEAYSPLRQEVGDGRKATKLQGDFFPNTKLPPWHRREPGDVEAEAIWTHFEDQNPFPISRDDVIRLGKDPKRAAKFPDDIFGLGDEAYIATLDVQHKIHCLNELRKMAFINYGKTHKDDFVDTTEYTRTYWQHHLHCVSLLTQDLLCHSDLDVNTYEWRDTQGHPFPDFSINRQCRSIDDVMAYRDKYGVDVHLYDHMKRPQLQDIDLLPMEPDYYGEYGFANSLLFPGGKGYDGSVETSNFTAWYGVAPPRDGAVHKM